MTPASNWVPEPPYMIWRISALFHPFAVGPIGGNGIVYVGDGKDPGQHGDRFAGQAVRIAVAVKTLVVAADDVLFPVPQAQALHDIGADHRVLFDQAEFFIGQAAGLEQNVIPDTDLPDVVELAGDVENILFLLTAAHGPAQGYGNPGHPVGVLLGVRIAGFNNTDERRTGWQRDSHKYFRKGDVFDGIGRLVGHERHVVQIFFRKADIPVKHRYGQYAEHFFADIQRNQHHGPDVGGQSLHAGCFHGSAAACPHRNCPGSTG
jgi:hypothetical protein